MNLTTPTLQSTKRLLKRSLALLTAIAAPSALYAQSCAMCYQNANAAGPRTAEALRHGILIMLFPPLFIFAGIIVLAHRRSNDTNDSGERRRHLRFGALRRFPRRRSLLGAQLPGHFTRILQLTPFALRASKTLMHVQI